MKEKYYIGLDMGTNSVGWAVTDEDFNLCSYRKKDMWGVRLFESANPASKRRLQRGARRRLERKKQRIKLLQMLFNEEMNKVDDTFFIRLNESRLQIEEKTVKIHHPLFDDEGYTDVEFYRQYPTMYCLRKELITSREPHDIRQVYLAVHHILKNRGHFLIDGGIGEAKNFNVAFQKLIDSLECELGLNIYVSKKNEETFQNILSDNNKAKSVKAKELSLLFDLHVNEKSKEQLKNEKQIIDNICKFIVGNKGDISKIADLDTDDIKKTSFKFSDTGYDEEVKPELDKSLPKISHVLDCAKGVYDWSILVEVLGDEEYLSFAKVNQYKRHKDNLNKLRKIIKKYADKEVYKEFFDRPDIEGNYPSYIGYLKKNGKEYSVKKCKSEEVFYKYLLNILGRISVQPEEQDIFNEILSETENHSLLPLQRSKDNSAIPNQVHKQELEIILSNASTYLPFLKEKDEKGITVYEKIISIFEFRIPYYVGPLSDRHRETGGNSWMIRKTDGRIYPWNFDEMVDREKSNERFITRMTNKCTYLIGEDVLPKQSILYSKFMVLNELNNLRIRGNKPSVNLKQKIFKGLFLEHTKVSGQMLLNYLIKYEDSSLEKSDISGFDEDFKSSMSSYLDFQKKVFGEKIKNKNYYDIAEKCIKWATIYGDDRKMLIRVIENAYGDILARDEIVAIGKLKYTGWGTLSQKLLNGIEGIDEVDTGEQYTIIDAMWTTNNNLMQLLSKNFSFVEEIKKYNQELDGKIDKITYDSVIKNLNVSPSVKRAVWQTIEIVEEISKVQGHNPEKIFIEMSRGEDKTKDRTNKSKNKTKSRKAQLLELYSACEDDVRNWTEEIGEKEERDFNSMKLFLYYTQKGRCMYTGKEIDIDQLMMANSKWDRDHIYPQSKIKDDSIDNLVLVDKKYNAKKSNELLSSDIQSKMKSFWKELLEQNFITQKKYDRLTRRNDFSDDELAGFINRQLVETRQSTKAVADLLEKIYPKSKIVYVKSELASEFRKNPLKMLKSRRMNDYHHAKDAYLNIVVGDVYNAKFTSNPTKWVREHKDKDFNINKIFFHDVYRGSKLVWKAPDKRADNHEVKNSDEDFFGGTIDTVKKTMKKNSPLYTEYTYCEGGELFKATIARKTEGGIPIKKGLDTNKYGGYKGAKSSYFSFIEFDGKDGERTRQIIGVPIYVANMLEYNKNAFLEYCTESKKMKNVKIIKAKIKKNSLLRIDGYPMRIRGETENQILLKNNIQLVIDEVNAETIRRIEKLLEKDGIREASEKFDKMNDEMLNNLFEDFKSKMSKTPYSERPANQYKSIVECEHSFKTLSLYSKAKVLNEILNFFRCDVETTGDLSLMNGKPKAGNIAKSKSTIGNVELVLVHESVTGLFVKKEKL